MMEKLNKTNLCQYLQRHPLTALGIMWMAQLAAAKVVMTIAYKRAMRGE